MGRYCRLLLAALLLCLAWHGNVAMAQEVPTTRSLNVSDSAKHAAGHPVRVVNAAGDTIILASVDSIQNLGDVEILMDSAAVSPTLGKTRVFNPDPQRALWLSALCPGLGQIYNRRYWKLPIVVGSFVGLSYGASWNNRMYRDYSKAYRDVMDDDPDTRSYMDFFPPTHGLFPADGEREQPGSGLAATGDEKQARLLPPVS